MRSRQARLRRSRTSRFSRRNRFGAGKPVDVTRIQSLVSITTPRDGGFHGPHSTPSFVEFDHDVRRIRLSLRAVDNANSDVVDVVVVVERKRRFRLRRNTDANRLCHSLVYRQSKYEVTRLDGIPFGSWYSFLQALISKLIFLVLEAKQESKIYLIK